MGKVNIVMKKLFFFTKVVLVFVLWVIAVGHLGKLKNELRAIDAPYAFRSVLWMAWPMGIIMAVTIFGKKIIDPMWINNLINKLKYFFSKIVIGRVLLFGAFVILTYYSAYWVMMGIHYIQVGSIETAEGPENLVGYGILSVCLGLIGCLFSNIYYKS